MMFLKKSSTILTLFLLIFFSCNNDSPNDPDPNNTNSDMAQCENGFAGIYPCNGYDLLGFVPLNILGSNAPMVDGNDIWGWTDPTNGKEYAIVCTTNGTAFVDITDPINPLYLGRIATQTQDSPWRDAKVYNNHVFIVADNAGDHGMQVFDLTRLRNVTNPPQEFTTDAVYDGVTSCHNIVINETEGVAYLVGCRIFSGGPVFVDISNPTSPIELGGYSADGYSHDAQVVTYDGPDTDHIGKEIYIGSHGNFGGSNRVVILDITDKTNPQFIGDADYPNPGFTHQGWFTEDMRYFILGDEVDEQTFGHNTKTLIFDMEDLDAPTLSSTYFGPTRAIDHNGYVKGNTFYLANYSAGMRVLDISNIDAATDAMTEIGFFDTFPENNTANFDGVWSIYPYFESGNIIISDINRGLFIVRKSGT